MKLSPHFLLSELLITDHTEYKLLQEQGVQPYITNLQILCNYILEPIRNYYKVPVTVTSGFRCKELNDKIGGSKTSQHNFGEAADFIVKGKTVDEVFADIIAGKINIVYRQCISEKHRWIHIAMIKIPFSSEDKYLNKLTTEDGIVYNKV